MTETGAESTDAADRLATFLTREEVQRRFVHVGGTVFPLAYVGGLLGWESIELIYLVGLGIALVLEFVRLGVGIDWWIFRRLTREYERSNLAGYALYVIGSTVAVLAFDPRIAVPAVLALAIVDPISGLLADNDFREPKRPAVLAVAFALSALIALPFVPVHAAALGAATTTVADGVTPVIRGHAIDDNLTIPIGMAVAMWVGLQLPI